MRAVRAFFVAIAIAVVAAFTIPATGATHEKRADITIDKDSTFDAAHGVRSGRGTAADPFVISGWELNNITIRNTSAHVAIRGNKVASVLRLNFIGDGVRVHDNTIQNLRVNENVKRTGERTSGFIERNRIITVGQLRHWDGLFAGNVVGTEDSKWRSVVNFDGFHGGRFVGNIVFGSVDVRLHGHHHGSSYDAWSHNHSAHDGAMHNDRWHTVLVASNRIYSTAGHALRYYDEAHAANDRTAQSEPNTALNGPHVHHTRVQLVHNELHGAGIRIDIFNADDAKHVGTARGDVLIEGNVINLAPDLPDNLGGRHGIAVGRAKDVDVLIKRNRIIGSPAANGIDDTTRMFFGHPAGIELNTIDKADVRIVDNEIVQRRYGVRATNLTASVRWWVTGLKTSAVEQDVAYDKNNVKNAPSR